MTAIAAASVQISTPNRSFHPFLLHLLQQPLLLHSTLFILQGIPIKLTRVAEGTPVTKLRKSTLNVTLTKNLNKF